MDGAGQSDEWEHSLLRYFVLLAKIARLLFILPLAVRNLIFKKVVQFSPPYFFSGAAYRVHDIWPN